MACSVCNKDQHSISESATCDWEKNHKGRNSDKRTGSSKWGRK